ncbi:helix-turn-helix transcriptional regulator [Agrobacterium larrymoorei]|uniref:LuxR family transcriptional regulator n=1 Tax=Agrobacterium larrymoorei TaxID=160699 RepID=A0A4D7DTR1_9HYPH|nr:LuxR family transcriptional regulator [Agrobacterium larrymoorei]QCJ00664.1 LuxR family transcriptional regulator [Agrobacterium larrymoorei]QYA10662.1 LuxR family transcriptional regulator [Agrobacterium larrymoorei]
MTQNQRLASSLTLLQSLDHFDQLESVLQQICGRFGVKQMAFLVIRVGIEQARFRHYSTTYPKRWVETYLAGNLYKTDPVIDILKWSRRPVDWSVLDTERYRKFFKDSRESGVGCNGMTIPLRGPRGERCLFSVTSDLSIPDWLLLKNDCAEELCIISHFVHEKALSLLAQASHTPRPVLSRRERQCLEQVATGYIPKQIAARLSISESSVRLFLRAARRKLDAKTSHQAVARASFFEMIDI